MIRWRVGGSSVAILVIALLSVAGCDGPWGPDLSVTVLAPPAGGAVADESYIILWSLSTDGYKDCYVSLFVDTDLNPEAGLIMIADSLSEESTGFLWDCSLYPEDDYFVRAVLTSGGYSENDYSDGSVSVSHPKGPLEQ